MPFAPPVEALNRGNKTLWGNLGDWSGASEYSDAANTLALRLGEAAGLGSGQRLLDMGCGAGDQLKLWIEAFGVESVTAVERNDALADRARERVARWHLQNRVHVHSGDAMSEAWWTSFTTVTEDCVLALDAAYFFDTRSVFLAHCHDALGPGGTIAMTDIVLGNGGSAAVAARMAPLFSVPRANMITEDEYRAMLETIGFCDVHIQDLTAEVLMGFAEWVRERGYQSRTSGGRNADGLPLSAAAGLLLTGRTAGFLARSEGLRYLVVTAKRSTP